MHSILKEQKSFGETRCRKSWDQFKEFDSQSPRYVTRVSGKIKDHRLDKLFKSHLDISEVKHAVSKFEDPFLSHEETERQERCAQSKAWDLAKNTYKVVKANNTAAFFSPAEEWILPAGSTKEPEEREFAVDSGAYRQQGRP